MSCSLNHGFILMKRTTRSQANLLLLTMREVHQRRRDRLAGIDTGLGGDFDESDSEVSQSDEESADAGSDR